MHVPRPLVPAVLLVVAMVVVPLGGVALANAVRPVIAPEPAVPLDAAANIPALLDPPATVRPLTTWFEPLPIVDPGSTATVRPFLARYRAVPVGDVAAATKLVDIAAGELRVSRAAAPVTKDFVHALTVAPPGSDEEPDDFSDESDAPVVSVFDTPGFTSLSDKAMGAIATNPANASAVNDLAVAIATTALADPTLFSTGPIASSTRLREAATRLLELGLASFPGDRAMTINLAYLRGLEGGVDDLGVPFTSDQLPPAIAALRAYVDSAPTDATARSLLANLVVRSEAAHGLDRATAIAQPLIEVADTEAAGQIVRADSLMYAADRDRSRSPFAARGILRDALAAYDRAIELTGDAAAYAGRARALDLLRSKDAAVEAQREAVRLRPTSVPWRLRLAQLEGCAGQVDAWRRDAQTAFDTMLKARKPAAIATRSILADPPPRDIGTYSIGSDLPTFDVTVRVPATGGAIVALDPFPEPETCLTGDPAVSTAVDDSALETALAAIAADDLPGARETLATWTAQLPQIDGEIDSEAVDPPAVSTVLELLAGGKLPEDDDDSIGTFLALASRLPPEAQARICRGLSGVAGLVQSDLDALTVCTAEAADRTGDHEAAARAIEPAVRLDDKAHPVSGSTALEAGILSELTGHLDVARARYEAAASYDETAIAGLVRLGDLDLREGDATGALDHYALAKAAVRTQVAAADQVVMDDALARRLGQYVDNNRGIALLMTARTADDAPPDCAAFVSACAEARDAFAAAMAADAMNPVYPMNAAWVARLTGDADRATELFTTALEQGTPLEAQAWNDLGVLAAQGGDLGTARADFVQAIATNPDYDLATWNLGVLEARRAGPMILAGQALLADATRLNRDLLTRQLAFQGDERVYRIEVSGTQLELARAPGTGAAIGAAAFGAIATVGAIGQLLSNLSGNVQEATETVASEAAGRTGRRLRGIGGRLGADGRRWPSWAAWIPALVVLTVTTAWTAAWVAPDAFVTAVLIGLVAAALALASHTCGHLLVAARMDASLRASQWHPGIALAVVGMPFHVPAGPFLAEDITTGDPRRDWWVSLAGILANLAAAGIALLVYLSAPMPFLRILIATQLAVAAFALIPSHPLDGNRLATQPIVLALISLGVAAAAATIAIGVI